MLMVLTQKTNMGIQASFTPYLPFRSESVSFLNDIEPNISRYDKKPWGRVMWAFVLMIFLLSFSPPSVWRAAVRPTFLVALESQTGSLIFFD